MSPHRALSRLAALLIVTLLAGCDNVEWGGGEIAVVPPPPKAPAEAGLDAAPEMARLPEGPVLFYVRPANGQATLVPVGEVAGDSLRAIRPGDDWEAYGRRFIAEHLRDGTEFTLFRGGARAGTLVLQSAALPAPTVCPRLPTGTGVLELVAGAEAAPEFLAMAKPQAPETPPQAFAPAEPDRRMQILAPILAERLLRARGAPLPTSWTRAMAQLKPIPADSRDAAFAATFLVGDTLGVGLDDEGHSLFFIGRPEAQIGYDTVYTRFTDYAREGKAAPRVVDFLDWDRDGAAELLLQVYGTSDAWFEALGRDDGGWRSIFRDRCPTPAAAAAGPDTAAAAAR